MLEWPLTPLEKQLGCGFLSVFCFCNSDCAYKAQRLYSTSVPYAQATWFCAQNLSSASVSTAPWFAAWLYQHLGLPTRIASWILCFQETWRRAQNLSSASWVTLLGFDSASAAVLDKQLYRAHGCHMKQRYCPSGAFGPYRM